MTNLYKTLQLVSMAMIAAFLLLASVGAIGWLPVNPAWMVLGSGALFVVGIVGEAWG